MGAVFEFLLGWAVKRFATKTLDTLTQETKYETSTTSSSVEYDADGNEIKKKVSKSNEY